MAGVSSKALKPNYTENKYKFNEATELNSNFDINLYETNFRSFDPQIGRFWQIDPLTMASVSLTPYHFGNNNPILFNDPFGLDTVRVNGEGAHNIEIRKWDVLAWTIDGVTSYYIYNPDDANAINGFVGNGIRSAEEQAVTVTARKQDNTSPWQLGREWLSGKGPREHHFKDNDPIARMMRKHDHIESTRNQISSGLANGTVVGNKAYTNNYSLGGISGVPKYIRDYSTLMTGGLTGNLAVTYFGSYGLKYEVLSIDEQSGTAQVRFFVSNSSTIASGTRPPVIGYTDWWKNGIGKKLNNRFSSGPMSKTTQTVEWTETIKWK